MVTVDAFVKRHEVTEPTEPCSTCHWNLDLAWMIKKGGSAQKARAAEIVTKRFDHIIDTSYQKDESWSLVEAANAAMLD